MTPSVKRSMHRLPLVLSVLAVWIGSWPPASGSTTSRLASEPGFGQTGRPAAQPVHTDLGQSELVDRLEQRIPQLMKAGDVPGLSVGLILHGALAWHRGFGVKNIHTGESVTDETVFEAASLGKCVFAYAVLRLVDEGRFDLDMPLSSYLPDIFSGADDPRLNLITTRHVLTHTTGLQNWPEGTVKTFFPPGERFSYSGEGFVLLSRAVEHVTGSKANDLVKQMVFEPLGMTNSSYTWEPRYERLSTSYHNSRGEPVTGQPKAPTADVNVAADLRTNAADYGRFLAAVLNGEGLRAETRRLMLLPQVPVREGGSTTIDRPQAKVFSEVSWGLGVGLQTTPDGLSFWHWGNNTYGKAYFVVFEKQQLGVVLFANSVYGLSIVPDLVADAVGGAQPAMTWLRFEPYTSPGRVLFRSLLADGAAPALSNYREWRKVRPQAEWVNEDQLNRFGLDLLRMGRVKDAIEVLKLNVEEHPRSFNVYDSLGEAYAADGNKELAIENYLRSIDINPRNDGGIAALERLRASDRR